MEETHGWPAAVTVKNTQTGFDSKSFINKQLYKEFLERLNAKVRNKKDCTVSALGGKAAQMREEIRDKR
jgi:hypothetical protein